MDVQSLNVRAEARTLRLYEIYSRKMRAVVYRKQTAGPSTARFCASAQDDDLLLSIFASDKNGASFLAPHILVWWVCSTSPASIPPPPTWELRRRHLVVVMETFEVHRHHHWERARCVEPLRLD